MDPSLRIETERLILRPHTLDDVEAAYQMNLDPAVSKYTGDGGVKTKAALTEIIKNTTLADYEKYGFGRFAVVHKADQKFIGFSGLKYLPEYDEVDLGYRFNSAYWGKGYATEAGKASIQFGIEVLQIKKIVGFVMPENKASSNVLKKLGFNFDQGLIEDGEMLEKYLLNLI